MPKQLSSFRGEHYTDARSLQRGRGWRTFSGGRSLYFPYITEAFLLCARSRAYPPSPISRFGRFRWPGPIGSHGDGLSPDAGRYSAWGSGLRLASINASC